MGKRLLLVSLLLLSFLSLSGCWDRVELESFAFVQALGLDLDKSGKNLIVTAMIAIPSKLGMTSEGSGSGKEPGILLISMKAPSIYEAFNLINTTVNREVTLLQNQILILGEELTKKGIRRWIDNLVRFREMRRTLLIFTCQGKAADILKVRPELDTNPAEYFRDLIMLSKRSGMYPLTNLHDFMNRYEAYAQQNYIPILAPYEKKKSEDQSSSSEESSDGSEKKRAKPQALSKVRIIGTAVFREDKVVGKLDLYESQVLQMLTHEFAEGFLTLPDPIKKDFKIIFRLSTAKPVQIKYTQKEVAHFNVKLGLEANIVSIQSGIDYTRPDKERFLGKRLAMALKKRIEKVIRKTQHEYRSDIFGFGVKVRNTMLTSTEWGHYRWPDKYPQSKIKINVKVFIRRVGVQFQPPKERG